MASTVYAPTTHYTNRIISSNIVTSSMSLFRTNPTSMIPYRTSQLLRWLVQFIIRLSITHRQLPD